jgi:hypothetical protein
MGPDVYVQKIAKERGFSATIHRRPFLGKVIWRGVSKILAISNLSKLQDNIWG